MSETFTPLLQRLHDGDVNARQRLFELLYAELRVRARSYVRNATVEHSLNATGLVHEAFLKFIGGEARTIKDRNHLLAMLSRTMRWLVTDHVRRRGRLKRIPPGEREPLDEVAAQYEEQVGDLDQFEVLLEDLRVRSEMKARAVELRVFGGLTIFETAAALGISDSSFTRLWQEVRIYFALRMGEGKSLAGGGAKVGVAFGSAVNDCDSNSSEANGADTHGSGNDGEHTSSAPRDDGSTGSGPNDGGTKEAGPNSSAPNSDAPNGSGPG